MHDHALVTRRLGLSEYEATWREMQQFTNERTDSTTDEFWLLEHPSIFTLGQAGKSEHLIAPGDIPVIKTDRGGQVTYHGPGQLIGYTLFDLRRRKLTVRDLVSGIELSIMDLLSSYGIESETVKTAPGVYVAGRKIAALGLRVRRGCSFHGLSINVDMDCEPFNRINPCGYEGLEIVQLRQLGIEDSLEAVSIRLESYIVKRFGYD
jgi:lipoyl(octanoyl) transferase